MSGFDDLYVYIILFFVAFFAGFIDSIVGGGGLITLPALIACGIPPHLALATNKLQSVFGSFTAALTYFRSTSLPFLGLGVFYTVFGAVLGSWTVLFIRDEHLKLIILFFLCLSFLYTALRKNLGKEESEPKIKNIKIFYFFCGIGLGFYDGFLGPATGSFWIFACVVLLGFTMKQASINTKIFNFSSNVAALGVFLWQYQVLWILGLLMGIGQILGAFLGSKLVLQTNGKFIKTLFLVIVGITILKVVWDYLDSFLFSLN
ncbi:TSUP family transporter [Campylobacter sp. MIT 21-1685]|uniref:TSUP family transporter n=1 Tax=unclassified Campylobacter TaxID=2593542 RepID=UPI00224B7E44|nr:MULTISPECIES: TSUP family transporter [unclassified Campylobacter]MCX2683243.1 TSUP family transporter [Campylobacter sp. MIT 21-1684]MCX2751564.1 TSUP family transporter [Campylobacter sp. MIT 21-1682]MCX2807763.1 TSUP family transporter [Campylobacter sp. MIT 21-1685]